MIKNFDRFSILAAVDREFVGFLKMKDDEAKEEHKKCDGADAIEEITPSYVIGLVTACLAGGHIFARRYHGVS